MRLVLEHPDLEGALSGVCVMTPSLTRTNPAHADLAQADLAQANLAWMRYPLDDPRMADMRDEIDRINTLGDRSAGCVWRFRTESGTATDVRVLDDPGVLFNLTIWRSVEDLRRYVYRTEHVTFFRRRREWFVPPPREPVVLWWVAPGPRPGVEDAMARFERLWRDGPTADAFTLKRVYGPDDRSVSSSSSPGQPI